MSVTLSGPVVLVATWAGSTAESRYVAVRTVNCMKLDELALSPAPWALPCAVTTMIVATAPAAKRCAMCCERTFMTMLRVLRRLLCRRRASIRSEST